MQNIATSERNLETWLLKWNYTELYFQFFSKCKTTRISVDLLSHEHYFFLSAQVPALTFFVKIWYLYKQRNHFIHLRMKVSHILIRIPRKTLFFASPKMRLFKTDFLNIFFFKGKKGRAAFFRSETIVARVLQLAVLNYEVTSNH